MSEVGPFPAEPLPGETNEAFAERKRKWARDNSERIYNQEWPKPKTRIQEKNDEVPD